MKNNNDIPDFAKAKIQTLRQRSDPIIGRLLLAIRNAKESDFTIYKPDHAQKLKNDILQKPRKELHMLISEFLTDSKTRKRNIKQRINSFSDPSIDPDPSQQLTNVLRQQEIRSLLRSKELKERKVLVENELKAGNSEILIAISNSPDSLIPDKTLTKYRNELAFSKDPDLKDYKSQVDDLEKIVRSECAILNSAHTKTLMDNDLDDPVTMTEHFAVFTPIDDNEKRLATGIINREKNNAILQKNKFDSNNDGIRL